MPFAANDRYLTACAIRFIPQVDSGGETFHWIDAELATPTWRVRDAVLEVLPYLAREQPDRAATLYRNAVSLHTSNGDFKIEKDVFHLLQYSSLNEQIFGDHPNSLICEFPEIFLTVALDLAIALWPLLEKERRDSTSGFLEAFQDYFDKQEASPESALGDIIDDSPNSILWLSTHRIHAYERLMEKLRDACKKLFDSDTFRFVSIHAKLLRRSRLATVQSILLNLAITNVQQPPAASLLGELLKDPRLYHVSDLFPWMEHGLELLWLDASQELRHALLHTIATTATSRSGNYLYPQLLCRLPAEALTEEQRQVVQAHRDNGFGRPHQQPQIEPISLNQPWSNIDLQEQWHYWGGEWPEGADLELLYRFFQTSEPLQTAQVTAERITEVLPEAMALAEKVLTIVLAQPHLLQNAKNQWVLRRFSSICNRNLDLARLTRQRASDLPEEFLRGCAVIARQLMAAGPTELFTHEPQDHGYSPPGTVWDAALELMDAAIGFPPIAGDQRFQSDFEHLVAAVTEGSRHDASEVFSQFQHADYLGIMLPEDLFGLVEALCTRLRSTPEDTSSGAEAVGGIRYSTWKDIADYAADSIETLQERNLLNVPARREAAYHVLTQLVNTNHSSRKANAVLQRLQSSEGYT